MTLSVRVVDTTEEFYNLKSIWTDVIANDTKASIFQSWAWQYGWWKNYAQGKSLRILLAEDNNSVCGILPMYLAEYRLFRMIPVRELRLIGTGGDTSPDYLGPIVLSAKEVEVNAVFADFINHSKDWDVVQLADLSSDYLLPSQLMQQLASSVGYSAFKNCAEICYAQLPATWDEYMLTLSKSRRAHLRHCRKKFFTDASRKFYLWKDLDGINGAMAHLKKLHHMRWQGRADSFSFNSEPYIAFHNDLARTLLEEDALRLYCLEADGVIIAMLYCYRWRGQIYYVQAGFDSAWHKYSPGMILLGHMMESAISEGNHTVDYLKGDHEYKKSLAKDTRATKALLLVKNSASGLAYRLRRIILPALMAQCRQVINKFSKNRSQQESLSE